MCTPATPPPLSLSLSLLASFPPHFCTARPRIEDSMSDLFSRNARIPTSSQVCSPYPSNPFMISFYTIVAQVSRMNVSAYYRTTLVVPCSCFYDLSGDLDVCSLLVEKKCHYPLIKVFCNYFYRLFSNLHVCSSSVKK